MQPNLNLVVGTHFLKAGFEARKYNDNTLNPGSASGNYTFDKNLDPGRDRPRRCRIGQRIRTLPAGLSGDRGYVDRNIDPAFNHFYYAVFLQDDWKVTSRLTLNLGLRWDYETLRRNVTTAWCVAWISRPRARSPRR